jgi:DNA modification methylase
MNAPDEPRLQTTTLWYHRSQQYGREIHGDPRYEGRTPAYVVWNLLERYTRPGDRVLDPFAGGGTAVSVARSLGRVGLGCDLAAGIAAEAEGTVRADARALPVRDDAVDFVFMDPPYSTHIEYSLDERCIGRLDAFEAEYFEAMDQVFAEVARTLRERRYLAVYVSDTFRKKRGFVGIGAELYGLLARRFRPIDHVAVVRGNRKLEKPRFHRTAAEQNFFLRGFNHLLIFKQERRR